MVMFMQERMSLKEFKESGLTSNIFKKSGKTKNTKKYNNQTVVIDGIKFDSKKEANRWFDLNAMLKAKLISNLQRQVVFELAPATNLHGEKRMKSALRYVCDFQYFDNTLLKTVVEDVKSPSTRKTALYRAKKHLMKTQLGLDVIEI